MKKAAVGGVAAHSPSAIAFVRFLHEFGLNGPPPAPLVNIAFFLGAGFSKAWNTNYPTGLELFKVTSHERTQLLNVERAANFSGFSPIASLTLAHVRQLVYMLDMNAKYSDIRSRYADDDSLRLAAEQLRTFFGMRLQNLARDHWRWFEESLQKFSRPAAFTSDQNDIRELFEKMFSLIDGSQGHLQGVRFNFITTNYDWLPEEIIDSVCSDDDSAFLYLYRGITPDSVSGQLQDTTAFAHSLVFNLLKLNGGLEVFRENGRYHFDYRQRKAEDYRISPPVLMLPSREQNYQDDYFLAIFPKAVRLLQESTILVLVGYSLPEDDALLRFIIRHFCEDEADSHSKMVLYVDMCSESEQLIRLKSVFPFAGSTLEVHTYSGGFAAWSAEVVALLQVRARHRNASV
jgi:hypothetical protein